MDAIEPPLNLMGYRAALALWAFVILLMAPPRYRRVLRLRASGWGMLGAGAWLALTSLVADARADRLLPPEYGPAVVLALMGVVFLTETGGMRRPSAVTGARLAVAEVGELAVSAVRALGWYCLLPGLAGAVPWWVGLDATERNAGRFVTWYALAVALLSVSAIGEAAVRRGVSRHEVANRAVAGVLVNTPAVAVLALMFPCVRPGMPAGVQAMLLGLILATAGLAWLLAFRQVRRAVCLPEREVAGARWLFRKIARGRRRKRFAPELKLSESGRVTRITGDLRGAPASAVLVRVRPRRIWVVVAEPTDPYAEHGGWTGMAPLSRPIAPETTVASARSGRLTIVAQRARETSAP